MNWHKLYKDYWQEGTWTLRLIILHTLGYLLLGLLSWCCTLIAPLRWWDLGRYLSFYPEWSKVLTQPWSLVTYALPHFNFLHFLSNMCLVYALLPTMEGLIGPRHFLWAYLGGIVAGALAYLLGYQLLGAELILPLSLQGASAAILSVCATGITVDRKILSMFTLRFSGRSIPPIALWILLFFIFISAGRSNLGGHLAHLGGILFGVGCGLYYRYRLRSLRSTTNTNLESLLEKIRHSGIHSLSPIERRLLMEHSSSTEDKN